MTTHDPASPGRGTTPTRALIVGAAAMFTDMLVHGLAVPVLPLLPAVVEQGPAATGILFASYAVAMIVATLFAGRLVDRHGPKTPLLIGLVGLAAATLLFATGGPYWLLLIARLAQGIAGGMSWVAALSLIAATTSFDKRGQAMGIAISSLTLGVLLGPPVAGFMVEHLGTASPFLLAAGIALADGVLRIVLVKGTPRVIDDTAGPLAVLRVPGSVSIVLAIAIGAGVLSAIEPVLPVHLGVGSLVIGLLFGLASLAAIIANPVVGKYVATASSKVLIGAGVVAAASSLLVIGWAGELWQTCVGMALLGISSALLLAPATTLISEQGFRSKPPTLGGSFALYNFAYAVGLAIGPLLAGFGVQQIGFSAAMTIGSAVLVAIGAIALTRLPGRQHENAPGK
ncbi:MFS transporter [Corynebacterium testudinoris]|uniref:Arabinose efflux permease family protein n=1 Tax=Corynebacterium testudinoris TaxID=136857 RepID=A0A0G3HBN0_9CORY|nr:MFS transporter [Corynebacterium testudinoris]AKK08587.1 arabinose efflux permease family protein [Corynebacterium testudinoris]MBX8997019.1 MFS transporter [Corynebacterium testudinoris]